MAIIQLRMRSEAQADGRHMVQMIVGKGKNAKINTGIALYPREWSPAARLAVGRDSMKTNLALGEMVEKATARIKEAMEYGEFDDMTAAEIRSLIVNGDRRSGMSVGEMFRTVASVKGKRNGEIILSTLHRLEAYCDIDGLQFGKVTKLWLEGWLKSMRHLAPSTQSIHLRNLRAVVNAAIDEGITANYPFRRFRIPQGKPRKRALSPEQIRAIMTAEFPKHLDRHRRVFMLIFMLIGINVADLAALKRVAKGRIEYDRAKTHRHYSVKVEPEAMELIMGLKGESHLLYMLDNAREYRTWYKNFYQQLHAVGEAVGIENLSSYYARHSWATIAASLDIPKSTIAAALGHGGNTVTDIYIDFDQRKVDEANRRVLDWVLYGKK